MKRKQAPILSWVEKIVNKGPFPNAQSNIISRILNVFLLCCILPIIGFIYVRLNSVPLLNYDLISQRFSLEIIIISIGMFLFSYTYMLYFASGKVRRYLQEIRVCVDYTKKQFKIFEMDTIRKIFSPPKILLILWLVTIPIGVSEVISNPIYAGDNITTILIGLILTFSALLNWGGSWMLFAFLSTSKKFGRDVPLRINPFEPDRIGGLAPLSSLSTFAIFAVGLLATIAIPLWYVFSQVMAIFWVSITSILIPCYFFYSMSGVYNKLKEERGNSLKELNDEIRQITERIRKYIRVNHEETSLDEKKLITLGQTLNSINIIYERVKSMHTFPINSEIIIKITLSAILPILGILVNFLGFVVLT